MVNNDQCSGSRPALTDLKSLSHCSFLPVPLSDEVMGVQGGLMKATHTSHQPCQPLAAHQPLAHGLDGWLRWFGSSSAKLDGERLSIISREQALIIHLSESSCSLCLEISLHRQVRHYVPSFLDLGQFGPRNSYRLVKREDNTPKPTSDQARGEESNER